MWFFILNFGNFFGTLWRIKLKWIKRKMQSICINTTRTLARVLKNGISTLMMEAQANPRPYFVSVACGFPKGPLTNNKHLHKPGKFGDDAWFSSTNKNADVLGEFSLNFSSYLISIFIFFIHSYWFFPLEVCLLLFSFSLWPKFPCSDYIIGFLRIFA